MKYFQPYDQTNPDAPYVDGNPATSTQGSIPRAAAIESPQREIVNAIVQSGQTPNASDNTQLWKAIQSVTAGAVPSNALLHSGADTSTTANLITIPTVAPDVSSLTDYQVFEIVPANANTGATTLTIKSFPNAPLLRRDGNALVSGDLIVGSPYLAIRLGSTYRLLGLAKSEVISTVSSSTTIVQAGSINPLTNSGTYTFTPTSGGSFNRSLSFTAPSNGAVMANGIFFTSNSPSPTDSQGNGPSMTTVINGSSSGQAANGGSTTYTIAVPTTKTVVKGETVTVTLGMAFPGTSSVFPASQASLTYIFVPSA